MLEKFEYDLRTNNTPLKDTYFLLNYEAVGVTFICPYNALHYWEGIKGASVVSAYLSLEEAVSMIALMDAAAEEEE
jgi:hypothetical protein